MTLVSYFAKESIRIHWLSWVAARHWQKGRRRQRRRSLVFRITDPRSKDNGCCFIDDTCLNKAKHTVLQHPDSSSISNSIFNSNSKSNFYQTTDELFRHCKVEANEKSSIEFKCFSTLREEESCLELRTPQIILRYFSNANNLLILLRKIARNLWHFKGNSRFIQLLSGVLDDFGVQSTAIILGFLSIAEMSS